MLFDALPFQDLQKHPEGGISLADDFFDFHHFRKRPLPENLVGQDNRISGIQKVQRTDILKGSTPPE
jgi:hypothetical protein